MVHVNFCIQVNKEKTWLEQEDKDLTSYHLQSCEIKDVHVRDWTSNKDKTFWNGAAEYVNARHNRKRSGMYYMTHLLSRVRAK